MCIHTYCDLIFSSVDKSCSIHAFDWLLGTVVCLCELWPRGWSCLRMSMIESLLICVSFDHVCGLAWGWAWLNHCWSVWALTTWVVLLEDERDWIIVDLCKLWPRGWSCLRMSVISCDEDESLLICSYVLCSGQVDNFVTVSGSRWTSKADHCTGVYIWPSCSWYKSGQMELSYLFNINLAVWRREPLF